MGNGIKRILICLAICTSLFISCTTTKAPVTPPVPDLSNPDQKINVGFTTHIKGNAFTRYDWLVFVPYGLDLSKKQILMITGTNGNVMSSDYTLSINQHKELFRNRLNRFSSLDFILLCPILPRTEMNPAIYFIPEFYKPGPEALMRPDEKIINIITELRGLLALKGISTYEKIILEGFSAGGIMATRMALLHPDKIFAIAAGAPGSYATIPLANYKGMTLNFHVGIADFEKLMKRPFNFEEYKKVNQFLYIGDQDLKPNNSTLTNPGEIFSEYKIQQIKTLFGATDPEILQNEAKLLQETGCSVEFKLYQNVGHDSGNPLMVLDVMRFLQKMKEKMKQDS